MGCRYSKNLCGTRRLGIAVSLAAVLMAASGPRLMAQSDESGSEEALVGTWMVEVTLRNCDTGAPLAAAFPSLVTFHRGGTISESTTSGGSFATGQRSAGQGIWRRDQGRNFTMKLVALILFDSAANLPGTPGFNPNMPVSPGFFAGLATVTHEVELSDADRMKSAGTNAFFKFDGTLYRTGCSTVEARRFK